MTGQGDTNAIREGIQGSINSFAQEPIETINYVSAHDNLTLLDKITLTLPNADKELQHRALTLATAIPLLSQGVPFLEGGPEMGRTKGGNHNSYNAGDEANQFDWQRMGSWENTARTVKALIELRRTESAFRHTTAEAIRKNLTFLPSPEGTVAYRLKANDGDLIVLLNGTRQDHSMPLPAGNWSLRLATDGVFTMQAFWNNQFPSPALTAVVLKDSRE
jgi:pullulanase